ncbi:conjugal transfer protein TraD (plasmid) [Sphingobium sp. SJ10-10]|uniref:conjugal transfer protein TraD n=1 Tax=Sphingobium sp. SJ10-10 TaxID=3114999 RepID=UPI002E18471B|nr:conjugal transfer protein TraD [Sphingobium sp. SJ10-10]
MRKARDYDAELKALGDKARALKARKVQQLGELVAVTGADALDIETLAGALLDAVESNDAEEKEAWRAKGSAFFQRRGRKPVPSQVEGAGKGDADNGGGTSEAGAGGSQG